MPGIYVLAVVLAINARNLRVGGGVGGSVGCLMSGIYELAVVLGIRGVGGGVGC